MLKNILEIKTQIQDNADNINAGTQTTTTTKKKR